jgi:DNA-binding LacI/PurR family transcriptional regulator
MAGAAAVVVTSGSVTLQTIADALGVSRTTVSNAYNRPDQLAPELRERILSAAAELGYAGPDPAARRLRSGRTDSVGLLLAGGVAQAFEDPAAALLLRGVARAVEADGLGLLLVPEHRDGVRDAVIGALAVCSMPAAHPAVQAALERRLPLVLVDEPRLPGHAYVGIDARSGARRAARHLLGLGHRRFAVLGEPDVHRERLAGYAEALDADGAEWSRVELPAVLAAEPRPTALLTATDALALRALDAARAAGLGVPEDLSVVGFDDVPGAASSQPPLTTIRQPLLEKGEIVGRLLTSGPTEHAAILPVELVVRGSTGPPPA